MKTWDWSLKFGPGSILILEIWKVEGLTWYVYSLKKEKKKNVMFTILKTQVNLFFLINWMTKLESNANCRDKSLFLPVKNKINS